MLNKKTRMMQIFYRAMRGENISTKQLAEEYQVTTKSISRDINEIKSFLAESRDLIGGIEFKYSQASKTYYLEFEDFILNKELIAMIKMMIGCRGLSKSELTTIIEKLKKFTTYKERQTLNTLIGKEILHYKDVNHDVESVIDTMWRLTKCVDEKREITIDYYKINRDWVERRIRPIAILFSDYYYYLIAYRVDKDNFVPLIYRVDRIVKIKEHRAHFELPKQCHFDEGALRNKIQFMFSGEYRKIKFSFNGLSVQAILDRIPTAKIIDKVDGKYIIEAETFGKGINMFLLSQGASVVALEPPSFVKEMREEIEKMQSLYE